MGSNFINIGNQTFADAGKIKYIISADYNKVARLLSKYGVKRDDLRVFDTTSNKSTVRSWFWMMAPSASQAYQPRCSAAEQTERKRLGRKRLRSRKKSLRKKTTM